MNESQVSPKGEELDLKMTMTEPGVLKEKSDQNLTQNSSQKREVHPKLVKEQNSLTNQ